MGVTIAEVQPHQFDDWLRLRDAVYSGFDRAFHQQEMVIYVRDPDKTCLVACGEAGTFCGMIELSLRNVVDGCLTSPVGYIEGIYVEPAHRGQGVARRLMEHAVAWCRARGCRELATDAELDDKAAQRFHRHLGFEETYRIVEFRKPIE